MEHMCVDDLDPCGIRQCLPVGLVQTLAVPDFIGRGRLRGLGYFATY